MYVCMYVKVIYKPAPAVKVNVFKLLSAATSIKHVAKRSGFNSRLMSA